MKMYASVYWRRTLSLAATVVALGIPWHPAEADDTLTNSVPAPVPAPQAAPAATAEAQAPALPFGVSEVVKMYQGGIGKDIIVDYIQNSVLPFHLTADGEIYLQHLGVPPEVMLALIQRDGDLQRRSAATASDQVVAITPSSPAVIPGTPPPVVPYAYPDDSAPVIYSDYTAYPCYGYPYFYGPDFIIGGGFGFGRGFG
ncbi:MAG TPA: hypothetical protein VKJ65_07105, partial [Phycisphaerae bacterium]|nr:hypothetical protein [Phycisphaerae bacterium]